ncbi:hypothetical protein BpHYR1_038881 [Brachionus plicatilis]|uniref:Uncharacterized protein n=1 Tax=Brachionus plicatilis TaxID=10195 RepID=A0A3M7RLT8_BRAPC|nr:hypothetical protein BpHYR1_038881 [Brachionus plicatilis]
MFSEKISFSPRIVVFLIIIGAIMAHVHSAPSAKFHKKNSKSNFKLLLNHKRHFDPIFDEVNRCILACGRCAEDLLIPEETDPEHTPSIQCANECLMSKPEKRDFNELIVLSLLSNHLFSKDFVKCYITESVPMDYSYMD